MKYATILLTLVAGALAMPQQDQSSTPAAAATTPAPSLTPQQICLNKCDPSDVTCRAACLGIARPNSQQAVDTTDCVAKCDQGDGSPAATEKYSQCTQACIASLFPSTQTIAPFGPGAAAPSNAPSNGATPTGAAGSAAASSASLASGTGANATPTGANGTTASPSSTHHGAASANGVQFVGVGLAGLAAAIFAF